MPATIAASCASLEEADRPGTLTGGSERSFGGVIDGGCGSLTDGADGRENFNAGCCFGRSVVVFFGGSAFLIGVFFTGTAFLTTFFGGSSFLMTFFGTWAFVCGFCGSTFFTVGFEITLFLG